MNTLHQTCGAFLFLNCRILSIQRKIVLFFYLELRLGMKREKFEKTDNKKLLPAHFSKQIEYS